MRFEPAVIKRMLTALDGMPALTRHLHTLARVAHNADMCSQWSSSLVFTSASSFGRRDGFHHAVRDYRDFFHPAMFGAYAGPFIGQGPPALDPKLYDRVRTICFRVNMQNCAALCDQRSPIIRDWCELARLCPPRVWMEYGKETFEPIEIDDIIRVLLLHWCKKKGFERPKGQSGFYDPSANMVAAQRSWFEGYARGIHARMIAWLGLAPFGIEALDAGHLGHGNVLVERYERHAGALDQRVLITQDGAKTVPVPPAIDTHRVGAFLFGVVDSRYRIYNPEDGDKEYASAAFSIAGGYLNNPVCPVAFKDRVIEILDVQQALA